MSHAPGHAQCDFGEARVIIGGVERKAHYLVRTCPQRRLLREGLSGRDHRGVPGPAASRLSPLWAACPKSILYDNTKQAVARILWRRQAPADRAFTELESHYLFEDRFGRPGKGNDKGKVEGMVGYVRRNFLAPVRPSRALRP